MNIQNLQTKKWYVVDCKSKSGYLPEDPIIKFLTNSIESSLRDYSDACILVTGNFAVTRTIAAAGDDPVKNKQPLVAATQTAFKNCSPLKVCRTETRDTFVDYADFINIAMPMYNLIECSDNYRKFMGF